MLRHSPSSGQLRRARTRRHDDVPGEAAGEVSDLLLDPWRWAWDPTPEPAPGDSETITMAEAVAKLHRQRRCRLVPIAVVGPRDGTPEQLETAENVGRSIGSLGVPVLCGGKTGVMEAAARGARSAGALTVGIVPDNDWSRANDFIDLPLATGLGPARNVLVARMSLALVAIGGQYGTITEVAYGLHFDKPVFGLCGAPPLEGVRHRSSVEAVRDALLPILLRIPDT